MLLVDRYLVGGGSALDLATGQAVRVRTGAGPRRPPELYERRRGWRVVDVVARSPRAWTEVWELWGDETVAAPIDIDAVRTALAGARDGCPHAVDLVAGDGEAWRRAVHDIAREGRAAGFVPISADVLGDVLGSARGRWPSWLQDRSLMVITCDGQMSANGTVALLRLAGRDARPHLVVRGATSELRRPLRLIRLASAVHEEPRVPDGHAAARTPAEDLAERAWQRSQEAGASDEATSTARWAVLLAPTTECEALARSALACGLLDQGRAFEARAALAPASAGMDHLPDGIRQRVERARDRLVAAAHPRRHDRALVDDFLRVLQVCQDIEDDMVALGRTLVMLRERVASASLAYVVRESNQTRALCHVGAATGDLSTAERAIESNLPVTPDHRTRVEAAWPVRYGASTIGALWCRWATALPVLAEDAEALLGLAATATAPRLYAALERGRPSPEGRDIPGVLGNSAIMQALRAGVLRAARSPFPVLIEGESGSGKELVARAIHTASPRRERRFSALNCAALSDDLAEAELFGHAKGAFTGAIAERPGLFEDAHGGTLFLDEVSELSSRVQAKLLRVLQEQEVRRLGEAHVRRIDTRIVAATNRPLAREVEEGRFRRDLRYRLEVVALVVPPLRDRLEDLPVLVRQFWSTLAARTGSRALLSPTTLAALGQYDWPGNVRELQNVLASLMVASPPRGTVGAHQLPAHVARVAALGDARSLSSARRAFEIRHVRAALARVNGNHSRAARDLGVSRQGLSKLIARLGLGEHTGTTAAGV